MKRFLSVILITGIFLMSCNTFCFAKNVDWKNLYAQQINEIKNEYLNGTREFAYEAYNSVDDLFFTLQDIDFDGVPELYHTQCSYFEGETSTSHEYEEIYYIKNGGVLKGTIESDYHLGLLPAYNKRPAGDFTVDRYQYVAKNTATGEIEFITNDSCNYGAIDYPSRTYLKLTFDKENGILKAYTLLKQDPESYEEPQYLEGYEYIADGTYFSRTHYDGGNLWDWTAPYIKEAAPVSESDNEIYPTASVKINGESIEFDQPPIIVNSRTLVPLRAIFNALGATVEWDDSTKTVTSTKDGTVITVTIGDDKLYINQDVVVLDVPAMIVNSRTLVPVRAVSEAFGCIVSWDDSIKTVLLTTVETEKEPEPEETEKSLLEAAVIDNGLSDYEYFLPDDYDGDGLEEAFVIIPKEKKGFYKIYFINHLGECSVAVEDIFGFLNEETTQSGRNKYLQWIQSAPGVGAAALMLSCRDGKYFGTVLNVTNSKR